MSRRTEQTMRLTFHCLNLEWEDDAKNRTEDIHKDKEKKKKIIWKTKVFKGLYSKIKY